jgi:pimeloyl-ACP methyl ester carboxylesterase
MALKSTNVRPVKDAPPLLRAGVQALAALSPRAAAAVVAPLFFRTPPRRRAEPAERTLLDQAERRDLGDGADALATWTWGRRGPLVLLAHGWGGSVAQLTPLVPPLLAAGYRVVAADAPGHGASAGRTASIPRFARSMARVEALRGPLHGVVAHSMGGAAFSLAAARGLAARRAVFIGPPSDAAQWYRDFVRFLRLPDRAEPALRQAVEGIAGERLDRLNSGALGPALRMPLLVIHDRHDREVALESGERVAADAPDGRLHVTEGLGHRRILRDPGVAALAVEFLGSAEAAGARRVAT